MSLMIDALKKYRQESGLSQTQVVSDATLPRAPKKYKKILIVALLTIIAVVMIIISGLLVFKHVIKQHITEEVTSKVQGAKEELHQKIEERAQNVGLAATSGRAGVVHDRLQQLQQARASQEQAPENATDDSAINENTTDNGTTDGDTTGDNAAPSSTTTTSNDSNTTSTENSAAVEAPASTMPMRGRLAARQNHARISQDQQDAAPEASSGSTADSTDDTTSSATTVSDEASAAPTVEIKTVSDEKGENNPTYQQALKFVENNQYNKALALLVENDELLFKTQGLSALLTTRIYLATEDYALAEEELEHALLLHPGSELELLELQAQLYFMQERYADSLAILTKNSPSLSDHPEYYALLANVYIKLGQPNNAISIFEQVVLQFNNVAEYWLGLAVAYQKAGEVDSAIVAYRRAMQLSQNDPQVSLFINQQLEQLQQL